MLGQNRDVFQGFIQGLQADTTDTTHECVTSYETLRTMQGSMSTFRADYASTIQNGVVDYGSYIKLGKRYYEIYGIQAYDVYA